MCSSCLKLRSILHSTSRPCQPLRLQQQTPRFRPKPKDQRGIFLVSVWGAEIRPGYTWTCRTDQHHISSGCLKSTGLNCCSEAVGFCLWGASKDLQARSGLAGAYNGFMGPLKTCKGCAEIQHRMSLKIGDTNACHPAEIHVYIYIDKYRDFLHELAGSCLRSPCCSPAKVLSASLSEKLGTSWSCGYGASGLLI